MMEPRATIPRWLGFSWWWLLPLAAGVIAGIVFPENRFRLYLLCLIALQLWILVQAVWLRISQKDSTAVYWLAGGVFLQIMASIYPTFSLLGNWILLRDAAMLLQATCVIAGTCYFIYDLQRFAEDTQGVALHISYLMAIFCQVFYFQFKLHEVRQGVRTIAFDAGLEN